jgi:arginine N-succinyltransferase
VFRIRRSRLEDVPTFLKLARMVHFINLPPSEQVIAAKIEHSTRCFEKVAGIAPEEPARKRRNARGGLAAMETDSDLFMFSIEDPDTGSVVGTSQVRAHQGGPGNPNWSMQITERTFRSQPLSVSTTHHVARLYGDESGPSEIGGLIIESSSRGHPARPGRLLSFVRFHFMGMYRAYFADRVLAEMMAPITSEGDNLFWDHFGRKFIPVRYSEADRFCQHNRQFIPELLPHEDVYLSLFPLEVQNQVGQVGPETVPARRLLESMGFKYRGFIDPFDGGPHLDAPTDDIPLVRHTRAVTLGEATNQPHATTHAIVSTMNEDGEFLAIESNVRIERDTIHLTRAAMRTLGVEAGATLGFTPLIFDAHPASDSGISRDAPAKDRKPRKPAPKRKKVSP